jgi:hypothetical protein
VSLSFSSLQRGREKRRHFPVPPVSFVFEGYGSPLQGASAGPAHATTPFSRPRSEAAGPPHPCSAPAPPGWSDPSHRPFCWRTPAAGREDAAVDVDLKHSACPLLRAVARSSSSSQGVAPLQPCRRGGVRPPRCPSPCEADWRGGRATATTGGGEGEPWTRGGVVPAPPTSSSSCPPPRTMLSLVGRGSHRAPPQQARERGSGASAGVGWRHARGTATNEASAGGP